MERLDHLAAKFKHKCDIHEAWTEGKPEMLQQDNYSDASLAGILVWLLLKYFVFHRRQWKLKWNSVFFEYIVQN